MYELKKISIDEGKSSVVLAGDVSRGDRLNVIHQGVARDTINSLDSITVGVQLLLLRGIKYYHRTSPIKEILKRGDCFIEFHTNTSTYRLTDLGE